jgi:hypothetical protein
MTRSLPRHAPVWMAGCLALVLLDACQHAGPSEEQLRVAHAFDSWKDAVIDHHADEAMVYIPHHVDDYLSQLNAPPAAEPATNAAPSQNPGVDLLLRRALEKKVPPDLRTKLTMAVLLQRITDRNLFNPHDLREISIGPVSVDGDRASAEVYYDGMLTAVRLPFLKEDGGWKIDVMAILPYAETLMRLDRELKGESEEHQVDQLVAKLPSL